MSATVQFRIKRVDPDANLSRFQEYTLPYHPGMTVLEALWYIVDHLDGSVAFRYSCRSAVCGSCAMSINGDIRLACETQVSALLPGTITLEHLPYMRVIRDLIVDLEPFFEKYASVKPFIARMREHERECLQSAQEREQIKQAVPCILCSSCYAACPMVSHHPEYLGPAALSAAQRFAFDSRNEERLAMLKQINRLEGAGGCHKISRCTEVCPKNVAPAERIQELKDDIRLKSGNGVL